MNGLSPRQAEIYRFIIDFQQLRGYSPTFREIAAGVGLSLSTVTAHLNALRDKGAVTWDEGIARSIRLTK
jgi:repressor LexA